MCEIYDEFGKYNATCASELLGLYPNQYNFLMSLNGSLMGFVFCFLVLLVLVYAITKG